MSIKPLFMLLAISGTAIAHAADLECRKAPGSEFDITPINNRPDTIVESIDIQPQPIFDLEDDNAILIHEWANQFHVTTQPWVIRERLKFDVGDQVDIEDLIEAEALLRNERYIRDALVRFAEECEPGAPTKVLVKTWDNWPLLPIFSLSRQGGENKSAVGIQHDNFFGTGIRTRIRYNSDEQRSGYQLTLRSAVHLIKHATVSLNLTDNDDGQRTQFVFDKPFYHLDTERMFYAEFLDDKRIDDIFQNDDTRNSFEVTEHKYWLGTGWQVQSDERTTTRLSIGYADEKAQFLLSEDSPSNSPDLVPFDRNYRYPWIAYEYVQRDIRVMTNVYYIEQPENVSIGWRYRAQLGLELNDLAETRDFGYHFRFRASKGYLWDKNLLLFNVNARRDWGTMAPNHTRINGQTEYFYRFSEKLGFYASLRGTYSENPLLDDPVALDDNTGVRGYPLQYQHGDHLVASSVETRWFTKYNFYQLFNLGFAAFADVGRAFDGDNTVRNETNETLASVGIGARLFSNRASTGGVLHIDLATPLTKGPSVDSWEVRVQMRRSL